MIKTKNPGILTAIGKLRRMSMNNPLRLRFEAYQKMVRDERSWRIHVWKEANSAARALVMEEGRAQGMEEGMAQGIKEGRAQGMAQGKAEAVLDLLKECGEVPEKLELRILSERDGDRLCRWLSLAAKSRSVAEFQKRISEPLPLKTKNGD